MLQLDIFWHMPMTLALMALLRWLLEFTHIFEAIFALSTLFRTSTILRLILPLFKSASFCVEWKTIAARVNSLKTGSRRQANRRRPAFGSEIRHL